MENIIWEKGTSVLVLLAQGLFAWVLWSLRRVFVRIDDYGLHLDRENRQRNEAASRAAALERRLAALEGRVALLPDAEALAQLAGGVQSLRGEIKALDVRIDGVDRLLQRLERALDRQEVFLRGHAVAEARQP